MLRRLGLEEGLVNVDDVKGHGVGRRKACGGVREENRLGAVPGSLPTSR